MEGVARGAVRWLGADLDYSVFFFNAPATTEIYTLSLHDALPISFTAPRSANRRSWLYRIRPAAVHDARSEEHTSELQSRRDLVCRLLLEKKKNGRITTWRTVGRRDGAGPWPYLTVSRRSHMATGP